MAPSTWLQVWLRKAHYIMVKLDVTPPVIEVKDQPSQVWQSGGYVEENQVNCDWLAFMMLAGRAWWISLMIKVAVEVMSTLSPCNFQRPWRRDHITGRSGEGRRDRKELWRNHLSNFQWQQDLLHKSIISWRSHGVAFFPVPVWVWVPKGSTFTGFSELARSPFWN